jgi:hypothetical protein
MTAIILILFVFVVPTRAALINTEIVTTIGKLWKDILDIIPRFPMDVDVGGKEPLQSDSFTSIVSALVENESYSKGTIVISAILKYLLVCLTISPVIISVFLISFLLKAIIVPLLIIVFFYFIGLIVTICWCIRQVTVRQTSDTKDLFCCSPCRNPENSGWQTCCRCTYCIFALIMMFLFLVLSSFSVLSIDRIASAFIFLCIIQVTVAANELFGNLKDAVDRVTLFSKVLSNFTERLLYPLRSQTSCCIIISLLIVGTKLTNFSNIVATKRHDFDDSQFFVNMDKIFLAHVAAKALYPSGSSATIVTDITNIHETYLEFNVRTSLELIFLLFTPVHPVFDRAHCQTTISH